MSLAGERRHPCGARLSRRAAPPSMDAQAHCGRKSGFEHFSLSPSEGARGPG